MDISSKRTSLETLAGLDVLHLILMQSAKSR